MKLIPVKYHNKNYPEGIAPQLDEIAGNFDSKRISSNGPYSLHTEYAYMARKYDSELIDGLDELKSANRKGIPQLWKSVKWGEKFAVFIERIVGDGTPPEVIEIHPPFRDYCKDFAEFWERYIAFYNAVSTRFPTTKILIENRCGTMYPGAPFLLSTCNDMLEFCRFLAGGHKELGIIIDYPQLFSAEKIKMDNVQLDKILQFNSELQPYADCVGAIHLWGKRKKGDSGRWSPHSGTLDSFFSNDSEKKSKFLSSMKSTFSDDIERYFVPEVNTSENDLKSIVNDMVSAGIVFTQRRFQNYFIAIDWETLTPRFVLGGSTIDGIQKRDAIGSFSFKIGSKKYCIGNKDVATHEFLGCPNHAETHEKAIKCPDCERYDFLKYCVRCTGNRCYTKRADVLDRCNQEHFVYLTYFPNNIVKVGVAHHRRKYARLYEQGAVYSYIIASCHSGEAARRLENHIRQLGFRDKVTSNYKLHHLIGFDANLAERELMNAYQYIVESPELDAAEKATFLSFPERVIRDDAILSLAELTVENTQQLTIWDFMNEGKEDRTLVKILDTIDGFEGELIALIGTIAILKQDDIYKLFDFKNIVGKEIDIKSADDKVQ